MTKNRLYTLSYFRKRLKDADINSIRLINEFKDDNDKRYWTILIDPGRKNIITTCYKEDIDKFWFKLNTPTNLYNIKTKSMRVIIENLKMILDGESNE